MKQAAGLTPEGVIHNAALILGSIDFHKPAVYPVAVRVGVYQQAFFDWPQQQAWGAVIWVGILLQVDHLQGTVHALNPCWGDADCHAGWTDLNATSKQQIWEAAAFEPCLHDANPPTR